MINNKKFLIVILWISLVAVVIFSLNLSTLFRGFPPPNWEKSGVAIELPFGLVRFINGDVPQTLGVSEHLTELWAPKQVRQSRPLAIAIPSLINKFIEVVSLGKINIGLNQEQTTPELGFLILNIIILSISTILTIKILSPKNTLQRLVTIFVILIMVNNPVTRAFFWTGHQQIFHLLIGPLTIFLILHIYNKNLKQYLLNGFALGLGILAYGGFITSVLSIFFIICIKDKIKNAILYLAIAILPYLLWVSFCIIKAGSYYNHEVEVYRQFIWVFDSFQKGDFLNTLIFNLFRFMSSFSDIQTMMCLIMLLITTLLSLSMYINFQTKTSHLNKDVEKSKIFIISIASFISISTMFIFYIMMGFYGNRLTWSIITTIIVFCGYLQIETFANLSNIFYIRISSIIYILLILIWGVSFIYIEGPWA
jgi:hypothetical protein